MILGGADKSYYGAVLKKEDEEIEEQKYTF